LWSMLVPEQERAALTNGKVKQLTIVPDGPLALLPFETLVVQAGEEPKYLLDVGPPIQYTPSATILYNLTQRRCASVPADLKPVLTVGDPAYSGAGEAQVVSRGSRALDAITADSQYRGVHGKLSRLPYSDTECSWVIDAFKKAGVPVGRLQQQNA